MRYLKVTVSRFGMNSDAMSINQLPAQHAGNGNQRSRQQRNIQIPRIEAAFVMKAQCPIERSQRQRHDGQQRMDPCDRQISDARNEHQVDEARQPGKPAAETAKTRQPQTDSNPEWVGRIKIRQIGAYQAEQKGYREMNQHRVDRMSADRHAADDGVSRHNALLSRLKSELSTMMPSLTLPSLIITLSLLSGCSGPQSILNPAGPSALAVSRLWWGMFGFSVAVLLAVMALWIYAMRRNPRSLTEAQADRINRNWIIGGGLVLPIIGIVALLSFGIPMGYRMLPLPVAGQSVPRIDVIGHQWWWEVRYPDTDIVLINELHLPAGTPVDIHVTSSDVIHSFWVPRLAGKIDMIPDRTNVLRIEADAPGQFLGKCAEFCGVGHAHMMLEVQVHTPEDFESWLEEYEYE